MAHIRYLTADLLVALRGSSSVLAASRLLGMSNGALRKRCLSGRYPELWVAYREAAGRGVLRGRRFVGRKVAG